jgi:pyruvate kinase
MRRTKIVATLGPATSDAETLAELVRAGVDVFRLNFSHGTADTHARTLEAVRSVSEREKREIGVLQDLSGPKIRTGPLENAAEIPVETGETWILRRGEGPIAPGSLTATLPGLVDELDVDQRILLRDGRLEMVVTGRDEEGAHLRVVRGGRLSGRAGINLPNTRLSVPSFTDKDRADLEAGIDAGVDLTALSFVRDAADLDGPRALAADRGRDLFLIAKIEKPEAIENLDAILDRCDGVMVARGDLGVEVPAEDVPLLQKRIIREANRRRKPVITATQMLESMIESPVPTRAEASDVANAIFDGTDAVMLSGETAVGKHAVAAVATMARIADKADSLFREPAPIRRRSEAGEAVPRVSITLAASRVAEEVGARAIITYTESGNTARRLASFRPRVPIVALSPRRLTVRRLELSWGVYPRLMPFVDDLTDMLALGERILIDAGTVDPGDRVVLVSGTRGASRGGSHLLKILTVGESD